MDNVKGKLITLKPDNLLLNPNFDGYKLSSQDVRVYSAKLQDGLWLSKCQDSFSYLYTRLQTLHNYLCPDPDHPLHVYTFSSRGHLVKYGYSQDYRLSPGEVVWQADMTTSPAIVAPTTIVDGDEGVVSFPPSLHFPSSEIAVVSNGCGRLYILRTNDREITSSWLENLMHERISSMILHSTVRKCEDSLVINVVLVSLTTLKDMRINSLYSYLPSNVENTQSTHLHLVQWITFTYQESAWIITRERHLTGTGSLEYCCLNDTGSDLILLCHDNYDFIYDSVNPVVKHIQKQPPQTSNNKLDYIYMQNDEDISVWVTVKGKANVIVTSSTLEIKVEETSVLEGTFHDAVDSQAVTWTNKDGQLEITLPKSKEGIKWNELFSSSNNIGEEMIDLSLVEEVHKKLAHLTSESWGPSPEEDKPAFNPGELESCDEASEDLILLQLSCKSHSKTQSSHMGNTQHLLNVPQLSCSSSPSFCLRHDVDGIIWQPEGTEDFTHRSTFHAFGYVRASKSLAKFTMAPSDCSYAAICELKSHLYVFCQQEIFGGELRNRKSGKITNTVSRQLLISLKNHDEVIGMYAAPGVIFILTSENVYAYDFLTNN